MTLLNPWVILGVVLMMAFTGYRGYQMGIDHAKAVAAEELKEQIQTAKDNAAIDAQALIDHERSRQEVKTVFVDKVRTITETIYASPTNCTLPDGYRVRLNQLIDAANSTATPIDAKLPAAPKTSDGKGG